jgi:hypothetical protein
LRSREIATAVDDQSGGIEISPSDTDGKRFRIRWQQRF